MYLPPELLDKRPGWTKPWCWSWETLSHTCQTPDLQLCKTINGSCPKQLNLWPLLQQQKEIHHHVDTFPESVQEGLQSWSSLNLGQVPLWRGPVTNVGDSSYFVSSLITASPSLERTVTVTPETCQGTRPGPPALKSLTPAFYMELEFAPRQRAFPTMPRWSTRPWEDSTPFPGSQHQGCR